MITNLNITSQMTTQQIYLAAYNSLTVPVLICAWALFILLFLLVGLLSINNQGSHPYKKFMIIWFFGVFITGMALTFIILSPTTVQSIINFVQTTFNW